MHRYSLTVGHAMRDGEGAARSHTSRGCAAHAVHPGGRAASPEAPWCGERTGNAASWKCSCLTPTSSGIPHSGRSTLFLMTMSSSIVVAEALAQRHPQSRRRGRLGTPAAVVLRMLVLKHLHDWTFDE